MNNKQRIQSVLESQKKKKNKDIERLNHQISEINMELANINKFFNEYNEKEIDTAHDNTQSALLRTNRNMKIRSVVGLGVFAALGLATLIVSPAVCAAPIAATIACASVAGAGLLHFIGEFIADKLPFGRRHKLRKQLKAQRELKAQKAEYEKEQAKLQGLRTECLRTIEDINEINDSIVNFNKQMKEYAKQAKVEAELNKASKAAEKEVEVVTVPGHEGETVFIEKTQRDKTLANQSIYNKTLTERFKEYKARNQKPARIVRQNIIPRTSSAESQVEQGM